MIMYNSIIKAKYMPHDNREVYRAKMIICTYMPFDLELEKV